MSQFMRSIRFIEYNTIGKEKTENQKNGNWIFTTKKGINILLNQSINHSNYVIIWEDLLVHLLSVYN